MQTNETIREQSPSVTAVLRANLAKRRYVNSSDSTAPAVTAVIPAYNMEAFLGRTLQSALGQTYPNLEIIVVDDGSTDGTRAVAERFAAADSRVRVLSIPNGGVAAARNRGTQAAETPYVAFLDADDLWHPEKIARQVAALGAHDQTGEWAGCYTLSRFIGLNDEVLANDASADARGNFFDRHVYRNHVGNGSNLLVRRDAVLAVGGFNSEPARQGLGGLEDYEFQLKLLLRYKLELVREFLVGYRVYAGQMSDDRVRLARARVKTLEEVLPMSTLSAGQQDRVLAHAQLTGAHRELQAGQWAGAIARATASIVRAPRTNLRLIAELVHIYFRRRSTLRGRAPGPRSPGRRRPFLDFLPTEGVAPADDINARPRVRLAALRVRSAGPDRGEVAPADRTVADRSARTAS